MNIQRREGFVEEPRHEPPTIEATAQETRRPRPTPPPEIEPSPAEQEQQPIEKWPLVVKLVNKPIRDNNGVLIHEVHLREPRAGDINRYGNPVRINQEGDFIFDERKMTYMIAALSNILEPFIEDMHPRDWNSCAMKLRNFFLPDPRAW
jgi:hypothetical protein